MKFHDFTLKQTFSRYKFLLIRNLRAGIIRLYCYLTNSWVVQLARPSLKGAKGGQGLASWTNSWDKLF